MRIVEVAVGPGRVIDRFGSVGARHLGGARFGGGGGGGGGGLAFLSIAPGGHLGRHPTVLAQLYCVVRGSGWVAGGDGVRVPIEAGQAALWDPGEEHASGSEEGMEVVVLEAAEVDLPG